ncbi:tRNA (N6-threonylcarbamoyladenosine(37)-N6)-methyltransferase TrmO [Myxococcota bacterium]|nr:tRNA (N6-threonylcarbamoyladenosine(37)-N6)-methyltransferase TrmO [Myxococcota bacterium]MBU1430347.1 tRNA (N6-threonylcarbamoyladenosine(37)-N6)-methyltransferase TrmO [Myxococcota bacterium]MBU1896883.1 tRNA (N6-threonylcarbamoyladenosine(37)-N6)-methyltransferase TrmO [Myxococcota bacterium]
MRSFTFTPIGRIRSPHQSAAGAPIQPRFAAGARGRLEVDEAYREGLADLIGFDRVWLLYVFEISAPWRPKVTPFRDDTPRGVFSTRAPLRPNPLGISTLALLGVDETGLDLGDVDLIDGTWVLDIKPYVPDFDVYPEARAGWLEAKRRERTRADERFSGRPPHQP